MCVFFWVYTASIRTPRLAMRWCYVCFVFVYVSQDNGAAKQKFRHHVPDCYDSSFVASIADIVRLVMDLSSVLHTACLVHLHCLIDYSEGMLRMSARISFHGFLLFAK